MSERLNVFCSLLQLFLYYMCVVVKVYVLSKDVTKKLLCIAICQSFSLQQFVGL